MTLIFLSFQGDRRRDGGANGSDWNRQNDRGYQQGRRDNSYDNRNRDRYQVRAEELSSYTCMSTM
jgi:hypothetical protein